MRTCPEPSNVALFSRCRHLGLVAALGVAALALMACKGSGPIKVGDAMLPILAAGTDPLPEGHESLPVVEILPGEGVPAMAVVRHGSLVWKGHPNLVSEDMVAALLGD